MSERIMRTVKRLDELVTDEQIDKIVQKYAMGAEIWWQRIFGEVQLDISDAPSFMPITNLWLGMRGRLVGREYYIWQLLRADAYPDISTLDKSIMGAIETMRARKAAQ